MNRLGIPSVVFADGKEELAARLSIWYKNLPKSPQCDAPFNIVFYSPEILANDVDLLSAMKDVDLLSAMKALHIKKLVALCVFDEAHKIELWGSSFGREFFKVYLLHHCTSASICEGLRAKDASGSPAELNALQSDCSSSEESTSLEKRRHKLQSVAERKGV